MYRRLRNSRLSYRPIIRNFDGHEDETDPETEGRAMNDLTTVDTPMWLQVGQNILGF